MSADAQKLNRKRPADSEDIDPDGSDSPNKPDDFKIKSLDEILQEKRRRIEKEDVLEEERSETSDGNSRILSPAFSGKRESRTSSKQGSPQEGGSEVIYQLSPEQLSLSPMSSTSDTPSKVKRQLSQDVEPAGRVRRGRKTTEEEEGEIVSDASDTDTKRGGKQRTHSLPKVLDKEGAAGGGFDSDQSDSESRKSEKQTKYQSSRVSDNDERQKENETSSDVSDLEDRTHDLQRKYSSPQNIITEEKAKPTDPEGKGVSVTAEIEECSDNDGESNEEQSADDTETTAASNRERKEFKETGDNEEGSSESGSESDESSGDGDDEEGDEKGKGGDLTKETGSRNKQQKEVEVESSEEVVVKGKVQDEESSSEAEDSSEEESEEESDSESSEESEQEEIKQKSAPKVEQSKVDEFESEDLHSELQQLKRQKPVDQKYRQKSNTDWHHRDDRTHRKREEESSDIRGEKERKVSDKEKMNLKRRHHVERGYSQTESRNRPHQKGRSGDKVDGKQKEGRDKAKLSTDPKENIKSKTDRLSSRDRYSEVEDDKQRKHSRRDSSKRKIPDEGSRTENKVKDRKDRDSSRKKESTSEKSRKDSRVSGEDVLSSKPKKDEGPSLVLTERERRQFSNEIVDIDSEGSSLEEDHGEVHSDSEMKQDQHSDVGKDKEKEEETKLPPYYPAVRGCRNVEEFQWLNRIEEGTYGVVYRAKDKRTGDIVALKKLKMEREKEGFPITSLREINTLLKAQHPNIVTVREIVVGSNMDKIYIVMDYVEHDLKVLMEHMTQGFRIGEVKTLMIQLLRAVVHMHDNWILHRDIKASNLLLSNKGILKVGDFGLAREYGSPLKNYTPIVVTLWYRAPELLLGTKEYSTPIDLWSVGCVFAELLTMKPLFPGKSEIDQINRIFKELGTPSDKIWPGPPSYSELPAVKKMTFTEYPFNNLRNKFGAYLTDKGFDLLNRFLTYDPKRRITAEKALTHEYFSESPLPVEPSMFPTWPAKSEMMKRPKKKDIEHSPQAPQGGAMFAKLADEGDSGNGGEGFRMPSSKKGSAAVAGFTLKF